MSNHRIFNLANLFQVKTKFGCSAVLLSFVVLSLFIVDISVNIAY
jgi:hypothetical protein